jgi:glycosyltransferase involved in cell wall biosynthesis
MISVIIPAFREAERIRTTLTAVSRAAEQLTEPVEVIVVDDGSDDGTADQVVAFGGSVGSRDNPVPLRLFRLERNEGKGAALSRGLNEARGEWIVMMDADLGETAAEFPCLLAPLHAGEVDMTVAVFPSVPHSPPASRVPAPSPPHRLTPGGFGLALRTARWGVARLTGRVLQAPLSGQRAFAARHLPLLTPLEPGFGLEVGMDIDALRAGLRVLEVPTTMAHARTGRDWAGFRHRGRQLLHIVRALVRRGLPRKANPVRGALE